jgi:hypothetical protein
LTYVDSSIHYNLISEVNLRAKSKKNLINYLSLSNSPWVGQIVVETPNHTRPSIISSKIYALTIHIVFTTPNHTCSSIISSKLPTLTIHIVFSIFISNEFLTYWKWEDSTKPYSLFETNLGIRSLLCHLYRFLRSVCFNVKVFKEIIF